MWKVKITAHEDGETWTETYILKIDAERRIEASEEQGNTASMKWMPKMRVSDVIIIQC